MKKLDNKSINYLKKISLEQISAANSGHPGIALGAASFSYILFNKHLNLDINSNKWINRDRFVLSAGHGSSLLYSLLHFSGFDIKIDDLKKFRQINSITPGHPEYLETIGVEATSGPLGQGAAQAIGMAIAQKHLSSKYNKKNFNIIDNHIFCLISDGDIMEGVFNEAASLAGHLNLDNLIFLYDSNDTSLDGQLNKSFSEDIQTKFKALNFDYQIVKDANNDLNAIDIAIKNAKKAKKPAIIEMKTIIGIGVENKENTNKIHGSPLQEDELKNFLKKHDLLENPFEIEKDVYENFKQNIIKRSREKKEKWELLFSDYQKEHPKLAKELINNQIIWNDFEIEKTNLSTRVASGLILNHLANKNQNIIGGSADLFSSNMTYLNDLGDFNKENYQARNIWYGVREFSMAAIANGINLYKPLYPFVSTFLVFSDYLKPAIRMAALQKINTLFIFSHDSVVVGEDGPTHQPIEQIASLRTIPNVNVIRPCDANECINAFKMAIDNKDQPSIIITTRQNLNVISPKQNDLFFKGAYRIYKPKNKTKMQIIATGSEVELAINVAKEFDDIEVISMPSMNVFNKIDKNEQKKIINYNLPRLSLELGSSFGWERFANYNYHLDNFGTSAKSSDIIKKYKFTKDDIINYINVNIDKE